VSFFFFFVPLIFPLSMAKIFLLITLCFCLLFSLATSLSCGKVYQGPNPLQSRNAQDSKHHIRATWTGFQDKSGTVTYSAAIITQKEANAIIEKSGPNAANGVRCYQNPGISTPDVFGFRSVGRNTSLNVKHLNLPAGDHIYVIVRASQGGAFTYSNSNGVLVGVEGDDDDLQPYQAGLIAMGVAIFFLLCLFYLLLICIAIVAALRKGDDKYSANVHRNENVEKV